MTGSDGRRMKWGKLLTDPVIWPFATGDNQDFSGGSSNRNCTTNDARGCPALGAHG